MQRCLSYTQTAHNAPACKGEQSLHRRALSVLFLSSWQTVLSHIASILSQNQDPVKIIGGKAFRSPWSYRFACVLRMFCVGRRERRFLPCWMSILHITLYFFCHILTHAASCVKMWLYDSDIAENFERYKGGECDAAFKNSGNRHAARAV